MKPKFRLSLRLARPAASSKRAQDKTTVRKSEFVDDSDGLSLSQTVQPDNALAVASTYTRDSSGRIVPMQIDPAEDTAFVSETHSVLDATGRFYPKTTNAPGHTETRVYDSTRGRLLSQTGLNRRTTNFTYDALGRRSHGRPDNTSAATEYVYDDSQSVTNPRNELSATSKYRVTITGSVATPSTTCYDRIGRAIRACIVGFDGQTIYPYNRSKLFINGFLSGAACGKAQAKEGIANNCRSISNFTLQTSNFLFNTLGRVDVVTAPDDTRAKTIYNGRETTSELKNLAENIAYERLNRLTDATVVGASTVAVSYDDLGTINNRNSNSGLNDLGAYGYVNGTNRVSNAEAHSYFSIFLKTPDNPIHRIRI